MFARLLAAFCLCNLVVLPVSGKDRPESAVVVYLSGAGTQPQRPLQYMKDEADRLMQSAGYRVQWNTQRPTTDAALVVIEFHGTCEASSNLPAKSGPLASTATSNGRVIPFASMDCSGLSGVLASALGNEPGARRDFLYGRAMARLLAHELHHILEHTTEHTRDGVARACVHASDLLAEDFGW
jgi:hypothetical protein